MTFVWCFFNSTKSILCRGKRTKFCFQHRIDLLNSKWSRASMSASRALSSGGIKVELNDLLNVFMKKKLRVFYTTWVLPYGFQSLSFMSTWKHCCRGFRWMLHVHSVGLHQQADNGFDHTGPPPPPPPPPTSCKKRVTGKDELGQGNTEKTIKKIWQQ